MVKDLELKKKILAGLKGAMDEDVAEKQIKPKALIIKESAVAIPKKPETSEEMLEESKMEPMDDEGMPEEAMEEPSAMSKLEQIKAILEEPEEMEEEEEEEGGELPFEGSFFDKLKNLKK